LFCGGCVVVILDVGVLIGFFFVCKLKKKRKAILLMFYDWLRYFLSPVTAG
jgi:hypothetical protein